MLIPRIALFGPVLPAGSCNSFPLAPVAIADCKCQFLIVYCCHTAILGSITPLKFGRWPHRFRWGRGTGAGTPEQTRLGAVEAPPPPGSTADIKHQGMWANPKRGNAKNCLTCSPNVKINYGGRFSLRRCLASSC